MNDVLLYALFWLAVSLVLAIPLGLLIRVLSRHNETITPSYDEGWRQFDELDAMQRADDERRSEWETTL